MKTLKLPRMDKNCKFCKEDMKLIKELIDNDNIVNYKIFFTPDRNSCGILTHYHINLEGMGVQG